MGWDDLVGRVEVLVSDLLSTGGYDRSLFVRAGDQHVWAEINPRWVLADDGSEQEAPSVEVELAVAAIPPVPPAGASVVRMVDAGWCVEDDGFVREDEVGREEVAAWLAREAITTLRDRLEADLDPNDVGRGEEWGVRVAVPDGPNPAGNERLEEGIVWRAHQWQRERLDEYKATHRELYLAAQSHYEQARSLARNSWKAGWQARMDSDDPTGWRREYGRSALAHAAAVHPDEVVCHPEMYLGLDRVPEYERRLRDGLLEVPFEGATYPQLLEAARGLLATARSLDFVAGLDLLVEVYDLLAKMPGRAQGRGPDSLVSWRVHNFSLVVQAGSEEQLVEALERGRIAAGDLGHVMVGPTRDYPNFKAFRAHIRKLIRTYAVVDDKGKGSYR